MLLRSTDKTKDSFSIVIRTPGGEVSYDVPAMKVKDYSLEDIFDRKLYCLIPFYIFTYEDRFKEINNDSAKTEALANVFKEIMEILDQMTLDGVINTFYKVSIIDMSRRVLYNLTKTMRICGKE